MPRCARSPFAFHPAQSARMANGPAKPNSGSGTDPEAIGRRCGARRRCALATGLALAFIRSESCPLALPFLVLWALAPVAAWWISQPLEEKTAGLIARASTIPPRHGRAKRGAILKPSSARKITGCRRTTFRNIPGRSSPPALRPRTSAWACSARWPRGILATSRCAG